MTLSLRARLTLLYSALVALTIAAFGGVAYYTVSRELQANLDASLSRVSSSLHAVIKGQQERSRKPLRSLRRATRPTQEASPFSFLQEGSQRDFIGPIRPNSEDSLVRDPVWSAVYEHMLLNSSTYRIQVNDRDGGIVWRTDNLGPDSLPTYRILEAQHTPVVDGRMYSWYTLNGTRYRIVLYRGDVAEVTTAYPADDLDDLLQRLFAMMLYSLPVTLIVSMVAGWFLAQRSLRPVDVIARSARLISARSLSQRLPMPDTDDEIARLTLTLNDMIARLEQSFTQIRQFTSDASHELKTPLAIMLGELELALKRPLSPAEYRETLTSCLEEVERLTTVVQGLLELSRADAGQVQLDLSTVDLSRLTEDVVDDVMTLAEQRHHKVHSHVQRSVMVRGDRVKLYQALLNIGENAVKYTESGGEIIIDVSGYGPYAEVRVRDTGIGIPEEQMPFIFDRFYRVDRARSKQIGGTGLGLAITKTIIEAHGGTIRVESVEGEGTTFIVTMPRIVD